MKDFTIYKKIISLPDFLKDNYNFTEVKKGSTKNNPKLTNGNMTVVISKRNEFFSYFDVSNPGTKLSILDFMQRELAQYNDGVLPALPIVANMLDKYITEGKTVLPQFSTYNLSNASLSENEILNNINSLLDKGSNDFLTSRGFSEKTFEHPNFKDVIKYRKINNVTGTKSYDIAFVMRGLGSSRAISYRGNRDNLDFSFKGFHGPRGDTLLTSHFRNDKPIDAMYIGESFIDCMAHFELNVKALKGKNIIYISTEGSISQNQLSLIQLGISKQKPEKIYTIFDNDLYGHQAATLLFSYLKLPSSLLYDVKPDSFYSQNLLNLSQQEVNICGSNISQTYCIFNIPVKIQDQYKRNLESFLRVINNTIKNKDEQLSLEFHANEEKTVKYKVILPNTIDGWKNLRRLIINFKFGNSKFINTNFPKNKDFNLDLIDYKKVIDSKLQKLGLGDIF